MKLKEGEDDFAAFEAKCPPEIRKAFSQLGVQSFDSLIAKTAGDLLMMRGVGDRGLCCLRVNLWFAGKRMLKGDRLVAAVHGETHNLHVAVVGEVES